MQSWNTMGSIHNTSVCMSCTSDVQVDVCMLKQTSFELAVHISDHHWELELRKTAYINEMTSSKQTQLYAFQLPVPVAGKDNQLKSLYILASVGVCTPLKCYDRVPRACARVTYVYTCE